MSVLARLELLLVLTCMACGERENDPPTMEDTWTIERSTYEFRSRLHDSFGTLGDADQDFQQWLARPDTCSVPNLVVRLEMAAGTFVWPDVYQLRGADPELFQSLRQQWLDSLVGTLDACVGARFGSPVRRFNEQIEGAIASPRAIQAMHRLLDGNEKQQLAALQLIALAPNRVFYERVAQLARSGDESARTARARTALVKIDSLSAGAASSEWASWIQRRLDDSSPAALGDLVAAALGSQVPNAPSGEVSVDTRRAAARAARVWRETTLEGRQTVDPRFVLLAKDPDDDVRREGVLMLEPTGNEDLLDLVETIATTDSDPRIRLIAYMRLPKARSEKIPIERRP